MGDHAIVSKLGKQMLEKVREICNKLPEVDEIIDGFGHTTFKVNKKSFVMMGESDGNCGLSFKSDRENQSDLIQTGRYEKTPYIGHHGWVSAKKDNPLDWNEIGVLLQEAYVMAAPKKLVKKLVINEEDV